MKKNFYYFLIAILLSPGFKQFIIAQTVHSTQRPDFVHQVMNNSIVNESAEMSNNEKLDTNEFSLFQNNPNPFNLSTTIRYSLGRPSRVKLTVYNVIGREIKVLVDSYQGEGTYRVTWNGTDNSNIEVSSGVYFCRLATGSFVSTKKMILMK